MTYLGASRAAFAGGLWRMDHILFPATRLDSRLIRTAALSDRRRARVRVVAGEQRLVEPGRTSDRGFAMKKLFLATTGFVVLAAASAGAADMSARPVYAPPAPVPVYSWTGIYWGGIAQARKGRGIARWVDLRDSGFLAIG